MNSLDVAIVNNWIVGIGTGFSIILTLAVIYISYKTTEAAKASAESATQTYELTKKMIDRQITREQRVNDYYKKMYSRKIALYSNECLNALMEAFTIETDKIKRNISKLQNIHPLPPFVREDLISYFEDDDIESFFGTVELLVSFKKFYVEQFGLIEFDLRQIAETSSNLIMQFNILKSKYS